MERPAPENGIFYTPLEIAKYNDTIGKVEAGGGKNFYTDRIDEGISIDPNTGNIQRQGFAYWDQFNPFTSQDEATIQKLAEGKTKYADAVKIKGLLGDIPADTLLEASGGKPITASNAGGVRTKATRIERDRPTFSQRESTDLAKAQFAETKRQAEQAQLNYQYNLKVLENERELNRADKLEARADDRRDRLDLLDRQDHRYSQEMQRYDKRRQKETIQSLVAGLWSLGAAFAM